MPDGAAIRPTSDRAREALFNILEHGSFAAGGSRLAEKRVLDAFAGTGALGLEALSRGAAHVSFIEQASEARKLLARNIATLGEQDRTIVLSGDATAPPRTPAPVALALLDPPYGKGLGAKALIGPRRRRLDRARHADRAGDRRQGGASLARRLHIARRPALRCGAPIVYRDIGDLRKTGASLGFSADHAPCAHGIFIAATCLSLA